MFFIACRALSSGGPLPDAGTGRDAVRGSGSAAAGIRVDPNGGADHDDINLTDEGYTAIDAIDKQLSITN
jgi:hypothetical protein